MISREYHRELYIAGYLNNEMAFQTILFRSGFTLKKARRSFNDGKRTRSVLLWRSHQAN